MWSTVVEELGVKKGEVENRLYFVTFLIHFCSITWPLSVGPLTFDPADLALTVHVLVSPSLHHRVLSYDVQWGAYLTGDSLFSSFLPFDRRLFFFLWARSCEPWGSSGIWGTLDGLRGLIVPGRRGRVIGEGARMGTSVPSTLSLVAVDTCREKWWSVVERIKRDNKGFPTSSWQNFYQISLNRVLK